MSPSRPLPVPTPETAHFWEGTRDGVLRLQRCGSCGVTYFPPQPYCPECVGRDIEVVDAAGTATVISYVISHRPAPGFTPPYVIAVVELAEGPHMLTNLVGVDIAAALAPDPSGGDPSGGDAAFAWLDLPVEVAFEQVDGVALPVFRPRSGA
jgi:uncharacterized protein